jgi:hypothetical protein
MIHLNIYITYLQFSYCCQQYWLVKAVCHNVEADRLICCTPHMGLSCASMKQLISPPRALLDLLYHRTMFDVRLKKFPVNNKHLYYYLLIASDTDTDHNIDCIRHYNLELVQNQVIYCHRQCHFLLLLCRAQGLMLQCDSQWVQWRLLINMIMNFWGLWKAGNFYTISVTTSFLRRTLLFAIGCEFAH